MPQTVYYARGGGLGHLTRARAFLHTLGIEGDSVIVSDSPFAADGRVVGDIPVVRDLAALEECGRPRPPQPGVPRPAAEQELKRSAAGRPIAPGEDARTPVTRLILDTFPAGLLGEIEGGTIDYVARYVRWDRYMLPPNPPQIRRAWVLEPLHPDQERYVRARAEAVVEDFELKDPPPPPQPLPDLPPRYVLIAHSGPEDECEELASYAREVCRAEGVMEPVVITDFYPATAIAERATRIFTGGGFNSMRQFGRDPRHRPLPFDRRFDDQYARVARMRTST